MSLLLAVARKVCAALSDHRSNQAQLCGTQLPWVITVVMGWSCGVLITALRPAFARKTVLYDAETRRGNCPPDPPGV